MTREQGLSKNKIVSMLGKSTHGELKEYVDIGLQAAKEDPEFLAHLIAWNRIKGQIRDSKVALPVVSLKVDGYPEELTDNSLAHLALLTPRELVKAYRFVLEQRIPGKMREFKRFVEKYLRWKEQDHFDRVALQHRGSLKELYALNHTKPCDKANSILFKGERPKGSLFESVALLHDMTPNEAAGTILNKKIPFLVAMGALREKAKDETLVLALINNMSPTELVTNSNMLKKLGVEKSAALRGAYADALKKAAISKKATLKTTKAAEAIDDEKLQAKLKALQEKQLDNLGGVDGNWLVLADKSSSMTHAIKMGMEVAALLARMAKGSVTLVFFNDMPRMFDVTGKSYEEIQKMCRNQIASGATSIGCGLDAAIKHGIEMDGVAVITDMGENTQPYFGMVYQKLVKDTGKELPVYVYRFRDEYARYGYSTEFERSLERCHVPVSYFDVNSNMDYYSLPNLVQTMRTNRYSLVDEVYATDLLKLNDVIGG